MLLRLAAPLADWTRLAVALEAVGSPTLAGVVRTMSAAAPTPIGGGTIPLAFTPAQAGEVQRVGAGLGLSLPATPVFEAPDLAGAEWVTSLAERAAAVAAADAIVAAHGRRRAA